eukprot:scaffold32195_cov41-Attheya_sp.AAC.2
MVCKLTQADTKIPYFNANVYLENKKKIGKVDEIFGPITNVMFTVKPDTGIVASSFKAADAVYIGTDKLLPITRFTQPGGGGGRGGGRGRGAAGGRGGGRGGGRFDFLPVDVEAEGVALLAVGVEAGRDLNQKLSFVVLLYYCMAGGLVGAEVFHQVAEVAVVAVAEVFREDVVVAGVGSKRKDSQTCRRV